MFFFFVFFLAFFVFYVSYFLWGCGQHCCWPLAMRVLLRLFSFRSCLRLGRPPPGRVARIGGVRVTPHTKQNGWKGDRRPPNSVCLPLALLVPGVRADHHDAAVAPDDPALAADLLDARLDLHGKLLLYVPASWPPTQRAKRASGGVAGMALTCTGKRSDRDSGHTD